MASTIKIKNSSTAGAVPGSGDLVQGELAVNVTDKKIYTKNASGTIVNLGTTPSITDNGNATAITIDSSENVGIGVSPSGWSGYKVLQAGIGSFIGGSSGAYIISDNAYTDSSGASWKYISGSYAAAQYYAASGAHVWRTAGSGAQDGTISFTQAMTLDASGNLLLGTTSKLSPNSGAAEISIQNALSSELILNCTKTGGIKWDINSGSSGSAGGGFLSFYDLTSSATRMQIDSSGNLQVGTTTSAGRVTIKGTTTDNSTTSITVQDSAATSLFYVRNDGLVNTGISTNSPYNATTASSANLLVTSSGTLSRATSALKYKQDVRNLENVNISTFRPVRYKSKCDLDDSTNDYIGFIADEYVDSYPELVSFGSEGQVEGFAYERMTAILCKAIQEQQAIIESLTARITALEA